MALVAHFPLNKNSENYVGIGYKLLKDEEMTFVKGGKIGKCAQFDGNAFLSGELDDGVDEEFSFTFWIKVDILQTSTVRYILAKNTNDYASSNFEYGIYIPANYKVLKIIVYGKGFDTDIKPEQGIWTHITVTFKNNIVKMYKDGIKVYEGISTAIKYKKKYLCIGARSNNDTGTIGYGYFTGGCLNDIRVYNHCLSDSEIKEIYKTPILKYSFDYPLTDPKINTARDFTMPWSKVENNCSNMGTIIYDKEYIVDNQLFTVSFDIDIKDIVREDGKQASINFQDNTILNGETSNKWGTLIKVNAEINGNSEYFAGDTNTREVNLKNNGTYHIVRTYRITNASRFKQNWNIQLRTDNIIGGTVKVSNFRVVLGEKEILYDGTDGVVYDESGMGNDGVLIADDKSLKTTYSTDAKIGEGCYVCDTAEVDGTIKYSVIETKSNFDELNEFTISFWVYLNKVNRTDVVDATFLAQSKDSTKYSIWIRYNPQTLTLNSTLYGSNTTIHSILKEEEWIFITITVNKGSSQKIYINGELKGTGTIVSPSDWDETPLTVTDLRKNRRLRFDGKMDDLRIYATVLESDEVKRMYMERARVDSKGNLYCNELVESSYKIDYIRSDGNQYIDTEIIPDQDSTSNIKIEMKVGNVEVPDHYAAFYGSRSNNLFQFWSYVDRDVQNKINVRYSGRGFQTGTVDLEKPLVIAQEQNGFYINGDKVVTHSGRFHNSYNIYLFNVNNNGAPQSEGYGIRMDLYYCKMWKNDEIVRDFIPAISNEVGHMNEVCLYDLVTNRYFYNLSGAGEFVMNEPHLDMLATDEVKINEKGIVNCAILNEGKSIAKIIHKNSIFETNQINEN